LRYFLDLVRLNFLATARSRYSATPSGGLFTGMALSRNTERQWPQVGWSEMAELEAAFGYAPSARARRQRDMGKQAIGERELQLRKQREATARRAEEKHAKAKKEARAAQKAKAVKAR
jgi:hypothetical protein